MFKRIRTKRTSPEGDNNSEYSAIVESLLPHLSASECTAWYKRWKAGQENYKDSPFLRVVTFTNDVCETHELGKTTRRAIRDALCKSLLLDRNHHAA